MSRQSFHLQRKIILPRVGVRQARSAFPRRDGERIGVVSRRVGREVPLEVGDHLVDRHAVRVEEGVIVAPARRDVVKRRMYRRVYGVKHKVSYPGIWPMGYTTTPPLASGIGMLEVLKTTRAECSPKRGNSAGDGSYG